MLIMIFYKANTKIGILHYKFSQSTILCAMFEQFVSASGVDSFLLVVSICFCQWCQFVSASGVNVFLPVVLVCF